jgi:acetyl-CoA carboxylase biotin carboxylase subunit
MRVAVDAQEFRRAFQLARNEALAAFGSAEVYVEKYLTSPRHVEFQIMGDQHGHVMHLCERDCSVQRRHQKLIEEAPSPGLDVDTRQRMGVAAVRLAKQISYVGAGTIEFLLDEDGQFYFMEMNTRIQVEHPVTEMITGQDLIRWQIRIAAGESIDLKQRDIKSRGAAIECRINAEDPANGFRPMAGRVDTFQPAGGLGVRVDTHVVPGSVISPSYDSLLGKLIVHRPTRDEAIACMRRCLDEFQVGPIPTTISLYREILRHEAFIKGNVDTGFIERTW